MRLNSPSLLVFVISAILASAVVAIQFFGATIPFIGQYTFSTLLVAYALLFLGNIVRGM